MLILFVNGRLPSSFYLYSAKLLISNYPQHFG